MKNTFRRLLLATALCLAGVAHADTVGTVAYIYQTSENHTIFSVKQSNGVSVFYGITTPIKLTAHAVSDAASSRQTIQVSGSGGTDPGYIVRTY